jgi:hypothetical protein
MVFTSRFPFPACSPAVDVMSGHTGCRNGKRFINHRYRRMRTQREEPGQVSEAE